MLRKRAVIFILLTAVLVSVKAYCQEEMKSHQIRSIVGKVTNMDIDSDVVTAETGAITKQALSDAHLNADLLWGELINSGYIDSDGMVQTKFYALDRFSSLALTKEPNARKKLIYNAIQKALLANGMMLFYISNDSELLQGTHRITSMEIEQGDPVAIQFVSPSSDKNNVIRLVDNKTDDG